MFATQRAGQAGHVPVGRSAVQKYLWPAELEAPVPQNVADEAHGNAALHALPAALWQCAAVS